MIDTIIFDGEGVVIDTERIWDKAQEEFLRRRGLTYDREKIKHLITGKSSIDSVSIIKLEYGLRGDPKTLAQERLEIFKALFGRETKYVDGFPEFFARVRKTRKTCLATAMDNELLRLADERLGLSGLFGDRIFTLANVDYRSKPNPALLLFVASRLGSEPSQCVVIDDAPLGVEAAKRAGMMCIAITTTYDREKLKQADVIVDSFSEIEL